MLNPEELRPDRSAPQDGPSVLPKEVLGSEARQLFAIADGLRISIIKSARIGNPLLKDLNQLEAEHELVINDGDWKGLNVPQAHYELLDGDVNYILIPTDGKKKTNPPMPKIIIDGRPVTSIALHYGDREHLDLDHQGAYFSLTMQIDDPETQPNIELVQMISYEFSEQGTWLKRMEYPTSRNDTQSPNATIGDIEIAGVALRAITTYVDSILGTDRLAA